MLLLLFVVITDSRHMAMHFSTSVVFYQLGVSLGERSKSKTEKRKKKKEVGNVDIGWAVGHTWCACRYVWYVSLMTGNYDQGHRNTK